MEESRQQMSESMQGADARDPSPATMRSYMVAEIQAVVQKIQGVVQKPRKVMLTTSAGHDCNVAS